MRPLIPLLLVTMLGAALLGGCASGPKKIPHESTLYKHAKDALTVENWQSAANQFRTLISTYPFGKYATQARLNLIYAYYRGGVTDEAAKQADDFVKENPASPYAAYALFMKGVAYANALQRGPVDALFGVNLSKRDPLDQEQAFTAFRQLAKRYPDSRYTKQARQWMVFVRTRLAHFNLSVARFYLIRKQWVAAASRANKIVTEFPGTTATKPALKILMQSYKALGEDDLAAQAKDWYDYNYGAGAKAHVDQETASSNTDHH